MGIFKNTEKTEAAEVTAQATETSAAEVTETEASEETGTEASEVTGTEAFIPLESVPDKVRPVLKNKHFQHPDDLCAFVNGNEIKIKAIVAFDRFQAIYYYESI